MAKKGSDFDKNNAMIGETYGKLTLLEFLQDDKKKRVKVRCQCQKEYIIAPYLMNYQTYCCKCPTGFYPGKTLEGGIVLLEYMGKGIHKMKCVCGNIFEGIPRKYKGEYCTCGCSRKNKLLLAAEEMVGQKYEYLKVNKLVGFLEGHHIYEMKCKCGNKFLRKAGHHFKSKSCGCIATGSRGEKKGNARFKADEIISMRQLYDSGQYTFNSLADMFGVTESYVWRVVKRKIWKSV